MPVNADAVLNRVFAPVREDYSPSRTMLYALGVSAGSDPAIYDLPLVYERGLKALPTLAAVLAPEPFWMDEPDTGITFANVLHGEQGLQIHRPLPATGGVTGQASVEALFDKGAKGAVLLLKRELHDATTGELVATVRSTAFLRSDGGFGGSNDGQPQPYPVPDRRPDQSVSIATRPDLALLYRLSGDFNPLHIDPDAARAAGFERPILHGLCSYGIAGRAIIRALCGGDPERLTRLDVRFSSPVYPGETLITEIWQIERGSAAFRVRVAERDLVALNNGRADFRIEDK